MISKRIAAAATLLAVASLTLTPDAHAVRYVPGRNADLCSNVRGHQTLHDILRGPWVPNASTPPPRDCVHR